MNWEHLKEFLKSKSFRKHLGLAVLLIATLIFLFFQSLSWYTRHGQRIEVPSLVGMTEMQVKEYLAEKDLRYEIIDSVFADDVVRGAVFEQTPQAGMEVKKDRVIYLTMAAFSRPNISVPDMVDLTYREAQAILANYGLKEGDIIYKPDVARDVVLGILYRTQEIQPGTSIPKGSTLSLILGTGMGGELISIPNLLGLTLDEAMFILRNNTLNLGVAIYDETVKDTLLAEIYSQSPAYLNDSASVIRMGETIDLFFTNDKNKVQSRLNEVVPE